MDHGSGFVDAHLHLADACGGYGDMDEASMLFVCSARRSDWSIVSGSGDPRHVRFYGIHPWYADEWSREASEELMSLIASDPSAGIGEIGLDSRHAGCSMDAQIRAFEAQLDIAMECSRPVNIHDVGCDHEVLEALRHRRGLTAVLHSFSSESYIKPFSELGCYFSLNPRILARSDARLMRLIDPLPRDRILLESDFPFTPGFAGMHDFAVELARRIGVPADDLISASADNAARMIHV